MNDFGRSAPGSTLARPSGSRDDGHPFASSRDGIQEGRTAEVPIAGTNSALEITYDRVGQLLSVRGGGHLYLRRIDGELVYEEGWVATREQWVGRDLHRQVHTAESTWVESYGFDDTLRLSHVDGVDVRRDARGRVVECLSGDERWRYQYRDGRLVRLTGPFGDRRIEWDGDRPIRLRANGSWTPIRYDTMGRRVPASTPPPGWRRDELGRLWTVVSPEGRVLATYLWDGFACLGRVAGEIGEPLAEVYSLDPSLTPVRILRRSGSHRIPRDAFGEALLPYPGAPGLHGGAVSEGFVFLRARCLDPRVAHYDRPDPLHGRRSDPRRREGFRGPLSVDGCGRYGVCQYDPVGRTDPTGEQSTALAFLVHFNSLTWAMQNNVLGWLGLDFSLNFWLSLIFDRAHLFDFQAFAGKRQKTFAIGRGGLLATDRAWTFQHILWTEDEHIDSLADVSVVDPLGRWIPTLYGRVIWVDPAGDEEPFLLSGDPSLDGLPAGLALPEWTRVGGLGEAVYPGSNLARMTRGGLHLAEPREDLRAYDPIDCDLAELEPSGQQFETELTKRFRVLAAEIEGGAGAVGAGHRLLLTAKKPDSAAIFVVDRLEPKGTALQVWLEAAPEALGERPVRARFLRPAPLSTERLPVGPQQEFINLSGAAGAAVYEPEDPIRFVNVATNRVEGAGVIERLEASLELSRNLPNNMKPPIRVELVVVAAGGDAQLTADDDKIEFAPAPRVPGRGTHIRLARGANEVLTRVIAVDGTIATIADSAAPLGGADGDRVQWEELGLLNNLHGQRKDKITAPFNVFTYEPQSSRTAPPVNRLVFFRDSSGTAREVVARVQAVRHDALVFRRAVPIPVGANVDVERYDVIPAGQAGHLDDTVRLEPFLTAAIPGLPADTKAVRLLEFDPAALAAGINRWTYTGLADATATGPFPTRPQLLIAGANRLRPSQFVILEQNVGGVGHEERQLIRKVGLRVTLDRTVPIAGQTGIELVRLRPDGINYRAEHIAGLVFEIRPEVRGGAAAGRIQMAHFRQGELVQLSGGGLGAQHSYRVLAVERHGGRIELAGGPALPAPAPANLGLRRLVWEAVLRVFPRPQQRNTRAGINGRDAADGGGPPAKTSLTVDVWDVDDLSVGNLVGVINEAATETWPARIGTRDRIEVTFGTNPGLVPVAAGGGAPAAPVEVSIPPFLGAAFTAEVPFEDGTGVLRADAAVALDNAFIAIPFEETNERNGKLSPGTTYVPSDVGDNELRPMELDRRQALIDHELRHTEQSALLGPWLLGLFPMALFEWFGNDPDEPPRSVIDMSDLRLRFSPYVNATIERNSSGDKVLRIDDAQGVTFQKDELVQISQTVGGAVGEVTLQAHPDTGTFTLSERADTGSVLVQRVGQELFVPGAVREQAGQRVLRIFDAPEGLFNVGDRVQLFRAESPKSVTLVIRSGNTFALSDAADLPVGPVRVRREVSVDRPWDQDLLSFLTAGQVAKLLFSVTWGGFIELFTRIGYWSSRILGDDEFEASIADDPRELRFKGDSVPDDLRTRNTVLVKGGGRSLVRSVENVSGNVMTVGQDIDVGVSTVKVSPYPSQADANNWDWHRYFNATIPDPSVPARVQIEGSDQPSFEALDRVVVEAGDSSKRVRVVTDLGGGLIELEEEPPSEGPERRLRIAPTHPLDRLVFRLADKDVVRVFFDPWGELFRKLEPDGDFWKDLVKTGQILFSTRQWSLLWVPGFYFWDNLPVQIFDEGHRSRMEQDASEESGDLYSPLSRLRPHGKAVARVGDVGLFWFWPINGRGGPRFRNFIRLSAENRRGTPGAQALHAFDVQPRLLPAFQNTAAKAEPNGTAEAPPGSGLSLPDMLIEKDGAGPNDPPPRPLNPFPDPAGYSATDQGVIPSSARQFRVSGIYAAFSRPGSHRLTVPNDIDGAQDAREAQGQKFPFKDQPIFYNVTVADVTTRAAGQEFANGGTLTLVLGQRATVKVSPKNDQHVVSLLRPQTGSLVRTDGERAIVAQATTGTEPAEVARFYPFNVDAEPPDAADPLRLAMGGSYAEPRLAAHGVHVPQDLYVPVRLFEVTVTDTLPLRSQLPDADALRNNVNAESVASVSPDNEAFVLVPVETDPDVGDVFILEDSAGNRVADPAAADLQIDADVDVPRALRDFLSPDGFILRIRVDDGAAVPGDFTLKFPVKAAGAAHTLTTALQIRP